MVTQNIQILIPSVGIDIPAPSYFDRLRSEVLPKLQTGSKPFELNCSIDGNTNLINDDCAYQSLIGMARSQGKKSLQLDIQFLDDKNTSGSTNMVYQPLILTRIMRERHDKLNESVNRDQYIERFGTVDPDEDFKPSFFKDLQCLDGRPNIEFLIVVTMYDEDIEKFLFTMIGIAENLDRFKEEDIPAKEICVIVIVDGMEKFMKMNKTKKEFSDYFDEKMIKARFPNIDSEEFKIPEQPGNDNQQIENELAHCFIQNAKFKDNDQLQLIFCIKQVNKGKLNSHFWFFGGFCEMIKPKHVLLLDVGTKPLKNSLFLLHQAMDNDNKIAGCCGEIIPMGAKCTNIVTSAQKVEYKFAHIFDKSLESAIGYITVLPGAFSAYRWEALQGDPLWKHYFKSILYPESMDANQSNILLAEDRILCLALVSKENNSYVLRYIKDAVAETDVPKSISDLMKQRRRWINGSLFSLIDSIKRSKCIWESSHSKFQKCLFSIQIIYYVINVFLYWFMVGASFFAFAIAVRNQLDYEILSGFKWSDFLIMIYASALMITFILAIGAKATRVEKYYRVLAFLFGAFMFLTLILVFMNLNEKLDWDTPLFWLMVITILAFMTTTFCHWPPLTIICGIVQFLLFSPTFFNIFSIYAICNTHDCTWGNRPSQQNEKENERLENRPSQHNAKENERLKKIEEFEVFRTKWAIRWALCNSTFGFISIFIADPNSDEIRWLMYLILWISVLILVIRCAGGLLYLWQEKKRKDKIRKSCNKGKKINSNENSKPKVCPINEGNIGNKADTATCEEEKFEVECD